uniref:Putative MFS-type transporter PB1E7.08c n=1 Tax=Talaromyces marneffei PM1 TaxID=1077442 RepID=A0A093X7J4_TALMA
MVASKKAASAKVDRSNDNDPTSSHPTGFDGPIDLQSELIDTTEVDGVLARKMALVNAAIDEIGMTPFQWTLFFLNGFGYAVDSLLVVCQSIAQPSATQEFGNPSKYVAGISLASQIGLLVGAAFWGFSADVIGRKLAFNTSLFVCAAFVLIAGGMPNYISFSAMVAIYSAGAGGNYILDATNFLEFLPMSHAWLVTFLSVWWAIGYTIAGLLAWAFLSNFSCESDAMECTAADNMGWRYLHFTCGGLVLVLSVIRLFAVRMVQTPKWLTSQNRDEELYLILLNLSEKYKRPFSLTLEKLQSQGRVLHTEKSVPILEMIQTTLSGLLGPIIAGFLVERRWFGRRGTLAVGAAITTVLQLGYTQIRTPAQNVGISAAITATSNIYYGTIYAYTPEILPSAHRATGYGLCVVLNRVGGIVGVLVGSYANVETTVPLWICAGLYGTLVFTSLLLPFESRGKRTI